MLENRKALELKYKIYIFLIIVVALFFNSYFTDMMGTIDSLKKSQADITEKLDHVQSLKVRVDSDNSVVQKVSKNSLDVMKCINTSTCDITKLGQGIDREVIRNFLLISKNSSPKMDFDQKKVLANIDNFLIKSAKGDNIGNIGIITFAGTGEVDKTQGIYKVPITLAVDFSSKDNLIGFLNNVEKNVNIKVPALNVLYKVTSVNYDIANYKSEQTATVTMDAYFYK